MIITFEGAPAVGKSTVASHLESSYGCSAIPEVNKLFGKDNRDDDLWYFQKQVERWQLALQGDHKLTILDGDIFQPIWFNSVFSKNDWCDIDKMFEFYSQMVKAGKIQFPDTYVYFYIREELRSQREQERGNALGKSSEAILNKINRYSKFAAFQERYFSDLNKEFPGLVTFLESKDILGSTQAVTSIQASHNYDSSDIFQYIILWCKNAKNS